MPLKTLLALACSISLFSCATIRRPPIDICQVIAAPDTLNYRLGCYHLKDYQENGNIKPGTKAHFIPLRDIRDLNKYMTFYSEDGPLDAIAKMKAYIKKLREEYDSGCKANK